MHGLSLWTGGARCSSATCEYCRIAFLTYGGQISYAQTAWNAQQLQKKLKGKALIATISAGWLNPFLSVLPLCLLMSFFRERIAQCKHRIDPHSGLRNQVKLMEKRKGLAVALMCTCRTSLKEQQKAQRDCCVVLCRH